jgi:hypothetical protein
VAIVHRTPSEKIEDLRRKDVNPSLCIRDHALGRQADALNSDTRAESLRFWNELTVSIQHRQSKNAVSPISLKYYSIPIKLIAINNDFI